MRMLAGFVLAVAALGAAGSELSNAKSLKCEFAINASADWPKDQPQPKVSKGQNFGFHIDSIDVDKGTARIIGNAGSADLSVILGKGLHFLEVTPGGSLNVTTVYSAEVNAKFKAVHSRHVRSVGPLPSQHYGFCQLWR